MSRKDLEKLIGKVEKQMKKEPAFSAAVTELEKMLNS